MQRLKSQVLTGSKKELKRIEWNTVKRITIFLHYNSGFKKTKIAMQCNMSYDKFLLYLDWMDIMELIKKEIDDEGFEVVSLSERGNDLFIKKFKETKANLGLRIIPA